MRKALLTSLLTAFVACSANAESKMQLMSKDIASSQQLSNDQVLNGFGCQGGNQSPQLSWSRVPAAAKSFAITVYDPDAPTGSGWWHWLVYDVPASLSELHGNVGQASGQGLPKGAKQGRNDFGAHAYGGACPPPGQLHHYNVTLFALDVEKLPVDDSATAAMIGYMIRNHTISSATINAVYGRP